MMSKWLMRGGLCVLLILCLARTAAAQAGQQGSIQGTVTDPSGATMPGVTVSVKNTSTNVTSTAVTSESGA